MKKIIIVIILLWFISSVSTISAVNNDSVISLKDNNYLNSWVDDFNNLSMYLKELTGLNKDNNIKENNLTANKIKHNINFVNNTSTNNINNNSSNIHHNKPNLVNLSTNKNKHGIDLFNDTLHNQNQYNKTCNLLGLNHSINNDPIFNDKKLNTSKSNSNMCDDSSEDNFLINPVPESDNKDYNILLLILLFLLVLLGAIILYKIKK